MEILLNRWRGTGDLFKLLKFNITGTMLYALYIGLLFGILTQSILIGVLSTIGFVLGESFGWGKWVGALCYPESKEDLQKQYEDLEGYNFPYIHYISNFLIKEREKFFYYCRVSLAIRGFIWGALLYLGLVLFGHINVVEYLVASIMWGIGFPLACWISTYRWYKINTKFISITGKWEAQEVYYGFIQFITNTYIIYCVI